MSDASVVIRPHPGPQESFLSSRADIVIFGGGAGGGKTFALLTECARHVANKEYGAVIFRRTSPQIENEGGLWDEATRLYPLMGATPRIGDLRYRFQSGATVSFAHLQHEDTVLNWMGSAVPLICFDELTHFSSKQFWYMLSRNRSTCGVRPYVRATCNPDADSWVATLIEWWINQDTGYAIPERSGVVRWFIRENERLIWGDSKAELKERFPKNIPKSLTFIRSSLYDNPSLMKKDAGYEGNLMALSAVERARLLDGNWKIRPASGLYFQRFWCSTIAKPPVGMRIVRGWDRASTPKTETNDPDWTCGHLMGAKDGRFYMLDHKWLRGTPSQVDSLILMMAREDRARYGHVTISLPQDPGQAGKSQVVADRHLLTGFHVVNSVEARRTTAEVQASDARNAPKIARFSPFSSQAEARNVDIVMGDDGKAWDFMRLCDALEAFPMARHDDEADAVSRAFAALHSAPAPMRTRMMNFMRR